MTDKVLNVLFEVLVVLCAIFQHFLNIQKKISTFLAFFEVWFFISFR
jgi:hypothetical protein